MRLPKQLLWIAVTVLALSTVPVGAAERGFVASGSPVATRAGLDALKAGGNAVAPGKRPLSSMSPTLVLKDGKPVLAVGAAGGPTIISQTLLAIIRTIDFGMDPKKALAAPRFHHQWRPDELRVENRLPAKVVAELEKRGHKIVRVATIGVRQTFGASDPRVEGLAEGY